MLRLMLLLFFFFVGALSTKTGGLPIECPVEGYMTFQGYKSSDVVNIFDMREYYLRRENKAIGASGPCFEACVKSRTCRYFHSSNGICQGFKEDFRASNLVENEIYTVGVLCSYLRSSTVTV